MRKNILMIILLIPAFILSQELVTNSKGDTIVLKSDKTWEFKSKKISDEIELNDFYNPNISVKKNEKITMFKKTTVKDGVDKDVLIKFSIIILEKQLQEFGVKRINDFNYNALSIAKHKLKNKFTFVPRDINWFYNENLKKWTVSINYSAQNDYGALKDGFEMIYFNNDGTEYKY